MKLLFGGHVAGWWPRLGWKPSPLRGQSSFYSSTNEARVRGGYCVAARLQVLTRLTPLASPRSLYFRYRMGCRHDLVRGQHKVREGHLRKLSGVLGIHGGGTGRAFRRRGDLSRARVLERGEQAARQRHGRALQGRRSGLSGGRAEDVISGGCHLREVFEP